MRLRVNSKNTRLLFEYTCVGFLGFFSYADAYRNDMLEKVGESVLMQ